MAEYLQVPFFDSDFYFHLPTDPPFQKQRDPVERSRLLSADLAQPRSWVLSGNVLNWEPAVVFEPTLTVFMFVPPEIRLARLRRREEALFGERLLEGGDMEKTHLEFMDWATSYDLKPAIEATTSLDSHLKIFASLSGAKLKMEGTLSTLEQVRKVLLALQSE